MSGSITEPYFEDFNIRIIDRQVTSPVNGYATSKKHFSYFVHYFCFLGRLEDLITQDSMTVTISANEQSFSFNVTIIDNNVLEFLEVFGLGLEVIGTPYIDVDNNVSNADVSINDVDSKCLRYNQLY